MKILITLVFIIALIISLIGGVAEVDPKFRTKLLVMAMFFAGLIIVAQKYIS
jgi:hypothetical protein